jgi:hypothetical protein
LKWVLTGRFQQTINEFLKNESTIEVPWTCLVLEFAQQIGVSEKEEISVSEFDLGAAKFWQKNRLTDAESHWGSLAVSPFTWAGGDDLANILGLWVTQDKSGLGFLNGLGLFDQNSVHGRQESLEGSTHF